MLIRQCFMFWCCCGSFCTKHLRDEDIRQEKRLQEPEMREQLRLLTEVVELQNELRRREPTTPVQ